MSEARVADLARAMELIAPTSLAEAWDNVGLLAGDPSRAVARVLLCIDCTRDVIDEATRTKVDAIVAYHPPIFAPMKRVIAPSIAFELVSRGIAVYSPHTALDAADGGTNDVLADVVDMKDRAPIAPSVPDAAYKLVTFVPEEALAKVSDALFDAGCGRIGNYRACSFRTKGSGTFFGEEGTSPKVGEAGKLETADEIKIETVVPIARVADAVRALRAAHPYEEPAFDLVKLAAAPSAHGMGRIGAVDAIDRGALVAKIKSRLAVKALLVAGPASGEVTRVAVCAGSGGELFDRAIAGGAQFVVTGEARHHDALRIAARGATIACALHSNSERIALPPLAKRIEAALPGVAIAISEVDREPFTVA